MSLFLDSEEVGESRSETKQNIQINSEKPDSFSDSTMGLAIIESVDLPNVDTEK